jgi:ribosomal protein S18 acetylase RimI-like enzyme
VPMEELERLAPGTWYVNVLAVYPSWRDRGLGTGLLALADRHAAAAGCRGTSIIVADANAGARRLYERCGYRERARRAMIKEGWDGAGSAWVLLVKPAPAGGGADGGEA